MSCDVFQRLHDSGIAFIIQAVKHGHFRVYLGDETEGHRSAASCQSWAEVERWLDRHSRIHFPKSDYALSSPPEQR